MKKVTITLLSLLVCFGLAQLIRPDFDHLAVSAQPPGTKLLTRVPDSIETIFRQSCYDCHSGQTDLRWFDKITPANFLVASHIKEGRKAFDFSGFDSLNTPQQNAALYYALNKALCGEMPLSSYTFAHSAAKLTREDVQSLKVYLTALTPRKQADSTQMAAVTKAFNDWLQHNDAKQVAAAPNGIAYIPNYRGWKAMSTTDRFDNGSMRIIYANEVAVEAIRSGHTNPWPDGAVFAKTAWQQLLDADGIDTHGQFIQVEFMIKDAKKYADTKGWGWARWRGNDLTPYGKDVNFVQECITCHRPMKDEDYVFTHPLNVSGNTSDGNNAIIRFATLPENPLMESVITSSVHPDKGTMSTLYGNKAAWDYARTHGDGKYPATAILYEVTWQQKPDSVWFGANVPRTIVSVERIAFTANAQPLYDFYEGSPLEKKPIVPIRDRVNFIVSQRMAMSP